MTANTLPWRVMVTLSQPGGFPSDEHTIAEMLQPHGYACGMSGKWHLGVSNHTATWAHLPLAHGFDSWVGLPYSNMPYCKGAKENLDRQFCVLMANHTIVQQPFFYSNMTESLTNHAIEYISDKVAQHQPFFFYMSYVHVHSPLFTSPQFTNVSKGGRFGDNVEEMDWSVGQLLNTLDSLGVANNTLVFFVSDNGPYAEEGWDNCGRTGGLKGSKGQTYEGGIRVPGIARWPGTIPDNTVSDSLVGSLVSPL